MLTRRRFLAGSTALAWSGCAFTQVRAPSRVVNDVHSQLNPTRVARVVRPSSLEELRRAIRDARERGEAVAVAGGRHAGGGQQFATGATLVDMRAMSRVLDFDPERGEVEVEGGIEWPRLIATLLDLQRHAGEAWGIVQKQGVDRISIGGTLSANAHGSGLGLKPFVGDVESFTLLDATGEARVCDRRRNTELFGLAAGGYGLFGVAASVRLRLAPRRKLERTVEMLDVDGLVRAFEGRIGDGHLYGSFQFATDPASPGFLRRGVLTSYRPAEENATVTDGSTELTARDWRELVVLAHTDKARAFETYAAALRRTSGRVYWSDTHQLAVYVDDYHAEVDRRLGSREHATERLVECFVPRPALAPFLDDVRRDVLAHGTDLIFGSVRLVERDDDTFLAWARRPWACVVLNLHTPHSPPALERSRDAIRRLIDLAIRHKGTYFLTYDRSATRGQVERCYPQLPDFLVFKRWYDAEERFQSDWYRHYRTMFASALAGREGRRAPARA